MRALQSSAGEAELVLNSNGSIYHLNLRPEDLGEVVLMPGDPDRVPEISKYFDRIDSKIQKREYCSHTGWLGNRRITVVSSGVGVGNVDIVMNELDALVNVNFETREPVADKKSLPIIRLGTCGSIHPDVGIDTCVTAAYGLGLDNLLHFYDLSWTAEEEAVMKEVHHVLGSNTLSRIKPYASAADPELLSLLGSWSKTGITATLPGFYAPQGRSVRGPLAMPDLINRLQKVQVNGFEVINFEMEVSALLGLGRVLNHRCAAVAVVVANRVTNQFSRDVPKAVDRMIQSVLESLSQS